MKVDQIYYFRDDFKQPIVLYEFDTNEQAMSYCNECDKRKTRQTCFESNGKYYVGEHITEDVFNNLYNTTHFNEIHNNNIQVLNGCILFYTVMEAYGDRRYYFNNSTKQFYREFISIGD